MHLLSFKDVELYIIQKDEATWSYKQLIWPDDLLTHLPTPCEVWWHTEYSPWKLLWISSWRLSKGRRTQSPSWQTVQSRSHDKRSWCYLQIICYIGVISR